VNLFVYWKPFEHQKNTRTPSRLEFTAAFQKGSRTWPHQVGFAPLQRWKGLNNSDVTKRSLFWWFGWIISK
jgi:hypothetical protein